MSEALLKMTWFLLAVGGRTREALDLSERLLHVAPFDVYWRDWRVGHFYVAGEYERALQEVDRVRLVSPDFRSWYEACSHERLGRFEEALRERIAYYQRCGAPCDWEQEALERGWAENGWEGSLRAWLEAATNIEGYSPWLIAAYYAQIGEAEQVFAWLERGYRYRDPLMISTKADPVFVPFRSDPRFGDLLRRIGFPEG